MELVCYPLGTNGSIFDDKKNCFRVAVDGKQHELEKSNWLMWAQNDVLNTENSSLYPIDKNDWRVRTVCQKSPIVGLKKQNVTLIISKFVKSSSDCSRAAIQLFNEFREDQFSCKSNEKEKYTCIKYNPEAAQSDLLQRYSDNLTYKDINDNYTVVSYLTKAERSCERDLVYLESIGAKQSKCYNSKKYE